MKPAVSKPKSKGKIVDEKDEPKTNGLISSKSNPMQDEKKE